MIIRKFQDKTEEAAIRKAKEELGEEVIILTTRQVKEKGILKKTIYEVTAAVEKEESVNSMIQEEANSIDRVSINKNDSTPTPSIDTYSPLGRKTQRDKEEDKTEESAQELHSLSRRLLQEFGDTTHPIKEDYPIKEEAVVKENKEVKKEQVDGLSRELLQELIRKEVERTQSKKPIKDEDKPSVLKFMTYKGIAIPIAKAIEEKLNAHFGECAWQQQHPQREAYLQLFLKEIAGRIETSGPFLLAPKKNNIIALVGATGVGKTTTVMKIAVKYAKELHKKVAIISLDEDRIRESESVCALMHSLNISIAHCNTVREAQESLANFSSHDLVLFDTKGRSQYAHNQIDELGKFLSHFPAVEKHLVLSSTTKDVDIYGTIKHFLPLNIRSLIFTKLDETISQGILINVCQQMHIPISFLTMGRDLEKDIKVPDPQMIARQFLMHCNTEEFQELRYLANV